MRNFNAEVVQETAQSLAAEKAIRKRQRVLCLHIGEIVTIIRDICLTLTLGFTVEIQTPS